MIILPFRYFKKQGVFKMDKKTLKECSEKLAKMKLDQAETLRNLLAEQRSVEETSSQGDDVDMSNNLNELNRLKNLARQMSIKSMQIENAEKRMQSGKFGICLSCEDDIPKNRLFANPLSIRCISCQEDLEDVEKENKMRSKRSGPSEDESLTIGSDED